MDRFLKKEQLNALRMDALKMSNTPPSPPQQQQQQIPPQRQNIRFRLRAVYSRQAHSQ